MDLTQLFIGIINGAADLPAELRAHAVDAGGCERSSFDETYIDFLDTQIRLGARGPEWTERLVKRRAGLLPYCGATLIRGRIRSPASDYTVYVDPVWQRVVYWEEYESDSGAA